MGIKLQMALDVIDLDRFFALARESVSGGVDIIEVGTPVIKRYGLKIVEKLHSLFPLTPICSDSKMVDFPEIEISDFFKAGSSYVSAMIFSSNENILKSIEIANNFDGNIFFSTMGYPIDDLERRVSEVASLGGEFFIAHGSGYSLKKAFDELSQKINILSKIPKIRLIAAGGLEEENINAILSFRPEIIIIGRGIYNSSNIFATLIKIKEFLNKK